MKTLLLRCVAAGLGCSAGLVHGQAPLADPTRPPMVLAPRAPASTEGAVGVAPRPPKPAPRALPRVTLVRTDPATGVGLAVIDDRVVRLGERVGEGTLASVDAQGVVLRVGSGWQRLSLWAAPAAPTPPEPAPAPLAPASTEPAAPETSPSAQAGKDTP